MSIIDKARLLRKNMTKAERLLWSHLRNRQRKGYKFLRQYPILYSDIQGQKSHFILDFYCHQAKICIEADGKYHESQKDEDQLRDDILFQMNIKTSRFSNEEILMNINKVLEVIDALLP